MVRYRNHVLFWLCYVLFKTYLNVSASQEILLSDFWTIVGIQVVFITVKIPVVYFIFHAVDEIQNGRKHFPTVIIHFAVALAAGSVTMSFLNHAIILPYLLKIQSDVSMWHIGSLLYHLFNLSFVTGLALSIRLFQRQYYYKLREVELQREKSEAELKYLKSQINPHFLFNTLNNIYSLSRKNSEQTSDAILRLSKLMRFMLYEAAKQTILLTDELKLIQDYISLEKLRYTDRLTVHYNEKIDHSQQQIAPLLLIHFVENAFKHGAGESRSKSSIDIDIELKNHLLQFRISNSLAADREYTNPSPIGLANIKRQLELSYPDHQLEINKTKDRFEINLAINLPAL